MQIVNFFQKNSKSLLKIHYDNNLITLYLSYNISSIWLFFYIHVWHLGVCLLQHNFMDVHNISVLALKKCMNRIETYTFRYFIVFLH